MRGQWRAAGLALLFTLPVGLASTANATLAATREVAHAGAPYSTIQSAINASVAGDVVFVHCGVYVENIVVRDGVSVTGAGAACASIDGGAAGSVVTMVGTGTGTTVSGFTIMHGLSDLGGGIYIEAGSPTITANVIRDNRAATFGGSGGYGGGIHVTSPASSLLYNTAPVITRNIIRGNRADSFGGGMELYADDGAVVSNNLFLENVAAQAGGGVDTYQAFPTIVNNTIVRNCVQGSETACLQGGGGISMTNSGVVKVINNVIAWNEAAAGGGGVDLAASTATFTSNDAFSNTPSNYFGVGNPTGSNGNIAADPLFTDEWDSFGGYQPSSDSFLTDAGSANLAPPIDLRGIPRPIDGNANGTAQTDIGARENEGITRLHFDSKTSLRWDPSRGGTPTYHLYRGDMETLKSTGIYTQDTNTVPGARKRCGLTSPSVTDTDVPATGATFFYLAVVKRSVEGTLGFDSVPAERPYTNANRCP